MFQPRMTIAEVARFLEVEFPQLEASGHGVSLREIGPGRLNLEFRTADQHLRPGGTVSGPSMFALADVAAYLTILAHIGPIAAVVTTNMSINFLKRPAPGRLIAETKLLKLGRRLAVVDIAISSAGDDLPCAQAVGTYSIPATHGEVS